MWEGTHGTWYVGEGPTYMYLRCIWEWHSFWYTVGVDPHGSPFCRGHHPYRHPQLLSGKEPKSVDHRRHQSHNHKGLRNNMQGEIT